LSEKRSAPAAGAELLAQEQTMLDFRELLWGIIAPPLLMALGMVLLAYLPVARRFFSTGALLALVLGVSLLGFRGWPAPGGDVHNWPAWIAFASGVITLCSVCGHGPFVWRILIRGAISALAVWLLLPEFHSASMGSLAWIVGLTVAWSTLILVWERSHAALTTGVSVTSLATVAGFSAACLLLFNTMTHAQFAGILTAALVAAVVLVWLRPAWYVPPGVVTVSAFVLPSLWLLGSFMVLNGLPFWALPLLALTGVAPLISTIAPVRAWSAWKRIIVANLAVVLLISPVLAWGIITSIKATAQPSYGY
jgi:hypothetical protein